MAIGFLHTAPAGTRSHYCPGTPLTILPSPSLAPDQSLAATLFGARIPARVAERTFGVLAAAGLARIWQLRHVPSADLIAMLDAGGYARYDLRTATRLLQLCEIIDDRYDGQVGLIGRRFAAYPELRAALDALPGWGPVTVRLFLRELRGVWPGAGPPLDERAATGRHTCRCRPEHSQATCCRSKAKACLASAGTAGAA